jgi:hypothetical protein
VASFPRRLQVSVYLFALSDVQDVNALLFSVQLEGDAPISFPQSPEVPFSFELQNMRNIGKFLQDAQSGKNLFPCPLVKVFQVFFRGGG